MSTEGWRLGLKAAFASPNKCTIKLLLGHTLEIYKIVFDVELPKCHVVLPKIINIT